MGDFIVLSVLGIAAAVSVRSLVKGRKKGGCGGCCSGCTGCSQK